MFGRRLNELREAQAVAELGHTDVRGPVKVMLVVAFVLAISSAGLIQAVSEWREHAPSHGAAGALFAPQFLDVFRHPPSLDHFSRYERELEDRSVMGGWILPRAQRGLLALGVGNDSVLPGRRGWLFYADDVRHLTGRAFLDPEVLRERARAGDHTQDAIQPDPVAAIVHFKQQLAERDIALVVVPTPLKPQLYPEKLTPRYAPDRAPLRNPSFDTFRHRLEAAGVRVFDPAPLLAELKRSGAVDPVYLATDTHWTPPAMQAVAEGLVEHLEAAGLVEAPPSRRVGHRTRRVARTALGDTFHMLALPEGVSAGYEPQTVTLRQVLPRHRPGPHPGPTRRAADQTRAPFQIDARIENLTRPPRPGTVVYRDAVVSLLLTDVRAVDGRDVDTDILVYMLAMRDDQWTPAARLERGQRVRLWIEPWRQREPDYGAVQRIEITDDPDALTAPAYWGEFERPGPDDASAETPGRYWRPDGDADVLLLGDSFSRIYSSGPAPGHADFRASPAGTGTGTPDWGRSAGFAEQLSLLLERSLDTIIIDGGGAVAGRRRIAAALSRGHDRLEGKRLVIWQFANRELSQGDWALIDLPPAPPDSRSDRSITEPEPARHGPCHITPDPGDRARRGSGRP